MTNRGGKTSGVLIPAVSLRRVSWLGRSLAVRAGCFKPLGGMCGLPGMKTALYLLAPAAQLPAVPAERLALLEQPMIGYAGMACLLHLDCLPWCELTRARGIAAMLRPSSVPRSTEHPHHPLGTALAYPLRHVPVFCVLSAILVVFWYPLVFSDMLLMPCRMERQGALWTDAACHLPPHGSRLEE
jgi:hypothetical protein